MLCEVVDSLLAEDNVCSGLLDVLDHLPQHVLFLLEECVELGGVVDLDLCIDLGLLDLEGCVDQCDLCVLDDLGHCAVDGLLVDDESLDELSLIHGCSGLLDGLDVVEVDGVLSVLLLCNGLDCVDDESAEELLGVVDLLGVHCGSCDVHEECVVVDGDGLCDVLEDLLCLCVCKPVSTCDDSGVNVGVDHVEGLLEELACEDDGGGGSVSDLGVLSLGDLDEHLCCGVLDIDLLEDGDTVVGDDDVSHGVDEHLVHSSGSKAAPDCVGDCPCC